jgi:hypothetical protein
MHRTTQLRLGLRFVKSPRSGEVQVSRGEPEVPFGEMRPHAVLFALEASLLTIFPAVSKGARPEHLSYFPWFLGRRCHRSEKEAQAGDKSRCEKWARIGEEINRAPARPERAEFD